MAMALIQSLAKKRGQNEFSRSLQSPLLFQASIGMAKAMP